MDIDHTPPHQPATSSTNLPPSPPPPTATSSIRETITGNGDVDMATIGATEASTSTSVVGHGNGNGNGTVTPRVNLRFKKPMINEDGTGSAGPSRASTPGSVTASGGGRASRRKGAMARASIGTSTPSGSGLPTTSSAIPGVGGDVTPSGALSIFAPPQNADLPEALQSIISPSQARSVDMNGNSHTHSNGSASGNGAAGPSTSSRELRVRLTIPASASGSGTPDIETSREAGPASGRLRPTRGRESTQRTGVSASGKGVKVGGGARVTTGPSTSITRKKGAPANEIPNQDFCSVCRGIGRFLCCDGCPRSFHFMCLEPPLRVDELPEEDDWYCRKCRVDRKRHRGPSPPSWDKEIEPIPAVFKQLTLEMESTNPEQFRLPENLRTFFTGVGTAEDGKYVEADESRTKYDRKGFQEERDAHRLKDSKSRPVSCYACGGSSIPLRSLTTDPGSSWRSIVSCDYCSLSWHLDCLDPPLAVMPNTGKKWMCPNHAEQVMKKRRTIREKLETVDVEDEGTPNNGNIVIVPDEPIRPAMEYEDLIINRQKFRVPEKIIKLDFWARLGVAGNKRKRDGSASSDMDTLADDSSASDPPQVPFRRTANREDLEAANLVLSWWNDGQSARHQPPLHTDPVSPNQSTKPDIPTTYDHNQNQNQNHIHNLTRSSTQAAEPFNLAAVDRWTPSMASATATVPTHTHTHSSTPDSSTAPASVAGSGTGEARKITLKVNKV